MVQALTYYILEHYYDILKNPLTSSLSPVLSSLFPIIYPLLHLTSTDLLSVFKFVYSGYLLEIYLFYMTLIMSISANNYPSLHYPSPF